MLITKEARQNSSESARLRLYDDGIKKVKLKTIRTPSEFDSMINLHICIFATSRKKH